MDGLTGKKRDFRRKQPTAFKSKTEGIICEASDCVWASEVKERFYRSESLQIFLDPVHAW